MKDYDKKNAIYKYGDEEFTFDFYTSLPISMKSEFVNTVSYFLVGNNYNVVLKELIFDFYIVKMFTNINLSDILKSDTFIDDVEEFLNETNIVEIVKANVKDGAMEELENALNLNIEYLTGIHRNIISESIATLVNTLEKKVGDFNIDPNGIMEMMELLNGISGELTMDNMLDAYARSDMYKNNRREIVGGDASSPVLSQDYEV